MIAVVKIGGHQALIEAGEIIRTDKIDVEVGETLELETLLLSEADGKNFKIGAPVLTEKTIAKVLEHGKDKKIRVFKMKPRKRYTKTYGHRQHYSVLEIISVGGVAKKASTEKKEKVDEVAATE